MTSEIKSEPCETGAADTDAARTTQPVSKVWHTPVVTLIDIRETSATSGP